MFLMSDDIYAIIYTYIYVCACLLLTTGCIFSLHSFIVT